MPTLETDPYLAIGAFKDATAASRLAIRNLCTEDLGEHVNDETIDGLYEAAKQIEEAAADLFTTMEVN